MSGTISNGGSGPATGGPEVDGGDHVNLGKAVILLVIGVIGGALLLGVAARPPTGGSASPAATTTTTTTHPTTSTTTTPTVPPSSVSVLVANGTSTAGMAEHYTTILQSQGWATKTPTDTSGHVPSSTVYYAAGQKAPATTIATELGLTASDVAPLTSSVPVSGSTGIDVVVVVGPDLASAATATTTSSTVN